MCIIVGDVRNVSHTRIFVAPLPNNRQLTIIANQVLLGHSAKPATMIIPIPLSRQILTVNMSKFPNFFDEFAKLFPSAAPSPSKFQSGKYRCQFVKTIGELESVVSMSVVRQISKLYGKRGFHYMCCEIEHEADFQPLAYVHDRIEPRTLFAPTWHIFSDPSPTQWDHEIYSMHCDLGEPCLYAKHVQQMSFRHWVPLLIPEFPRICPSQQVRRLTLRGEVENRDITLHIEDELI